MRDSKTGNSLAKFEVIATSGGRGGIAASGSFMEEHLEDGAKKTAEYLDHANHGKAM